MAELAKVFGERVKAFRAGHRMSQQQLAEVAGVSEEYVRQLEAGRRSPSFATIEKLASAFSIGARDFFEDRAATVTPEDTARAALSDLTSEELRWLLVGARLFKASRAK